MFQDEFLRCLYPYTNAAQRDGLWSEIINVYSGNGRSYHTLNHLDHLLKELIPYRSHFQCWETIVFAIAYHDVIYSVLRNDNEEKSADLAVKRLQSFGFDAQQTEHCHQFILATKKHEERDHDTNLFTDADLSILGTTHDDYVRYSQQVRSEYAIYPDLIYRPGRKKVLQHFLGMLRIFKTEPFFERYENAARINLQWESTQLE